MNHAHRARRHAGFTVVELLIAVIIVGVLVAVAYPPFIEAIRKGRRSEAFAALAAMQQAQERWRTNNASYTTSLADLNVASPTSSGYYTLQAAAAPAPATPATGYVVTAEGVSGTSQGADAQCRRLSVLVDNGRVRYAGCGSCSTFTYAATHPCWAQ